MESGTIQWVQPLGILRDPPMVGPITQAWGRFKAQNNRTLTELLIPEEHLAVKLESPCEAKEGREYLWSLVDGKVYMKEKITREVKIVPIAKTDDGPRPDEYLVRLNRIPSLSTVWLNGRMVMNVLGHEIVLNDKLGTLTLFLDDREDDDRPLFENVGFTGRIVVELAPVDQTIRFVLGKGISASKFPDDWPWPNMTSFESRSMEGSGVQSIIIGLLLGHTPSGCTEGDWKEGRRLLPPVATEPTAAEWK